MPCSPVAILASRQDRLALRLARALERRGASALLLDGEAAAALFTIRVGGGSVEITPSLPMFIRSSGWWRSAAPETHNEQFMVAESYSMVWAVAALSSGPVINRPARGGWVDRVTGGALQAAVEGNGHHGVAEVHASKPKYVGLSAGEDEHGGERGRSEGVAWGRSASFVAGPVSELAPEVPLRARLIDPRERYERVFVVGDRAFPAVSAADRSTLELRGRSVKLAREMGVHFASVTWAIVDGRTEPVRLNANPSERSMRGVWRDVTNALCEDLLS